VLLQRTELNVFDFIVIGKGLMGSAALRYLSEATSNVAVIGPDERVDYATHHGVFASHYDEGRLIGRLGKDLTWALLTTRSTEQFPSIEGRSGISFYHPCGRLTVVQRVTPKRYLKQREQVAQALGVRHACLSASAIRQHFPMFTFPDSYSAAFEPAPAGLIRPRALIRAQLAIGAQNGATIVREEVHSVFPQTNGVTVITQSGQQFRANRVLLTTGAFTNCYDLLERKLALRVKTETVLLAEVPESEVARLQDMPTLGYEIDSPALDGIYLTPPLCYPDGRFYIKLGCNTATDETLSDLSAMQKWMGSGRPDGMPTEMLQALLTFMPGLDVRSWLGRPCLVSYTPHFKPFVDQLSEQTFIATGGNGSSAQCSDMLGCLAANLVLDQLWPDPFARHDFRVIYADEVVEHIDSSNHSRL
jgi:sarcosine oxidase